MRLGCQICKCGPQHTDETGLPDLSVWASHTSMRCWILCGDVMPPCRYRGPFNGLEKGYCLFTHFQLLPEGKEPLPGLMTSVAQYGLLEDKPDVMTVQFK